ncbi:16S rRNA (cytidine(1402)-2'-O)-methyltransferase [bacterium]|nr:16S rRNA (cytidine(1402)-2'-O)-methyltransferase [bacterium]
MVKESSFHSLSTIHHSLNLLTLYIVSTPIGNLSDITFRAVETLKTVDAILAEDTRHTRPLLNHYGIQKELISYFEYSKSNKEDYILRRLEAGESMALVSDAGTPTLSDPGARLVAAALEKGIEVVPIPGVSALITALSVAGLPTEPLHFWGFLSPKPSKRKRVYDKVLSLEEGIHCFYETTHKIEKRLVEWNEYFKDYHFCVGREMTKKFESFYYGTLETIIPQIKGDQTKGEFVVLLSKEKF